LAISIGTSPGHLKTTSIWPARPALAQEAYRAGRVVLGMNQEDVELLTKYFGEVGEKFQFTRIGVRDAVGNKKRELWSFCKPDCLKQDLAQQIVIQDGVVVLVQTGKIKW